MSRYDLKRLKKIIRAAARREESLDDLFLKLSEDVQEQLIFDADLMYLFKLTYKQECRLVHWWK